MAKQQKKYYFFLTDANGRFYYATYDSVGNPVIRTQVQPIPLNYSPADLVKSKLSFATNQKYFSLNRTITYPLKFIKDGADILRWIDYNTSGYESKCYFTVLKFEDTTSIYRLAYKGVIDFSRKVDDPRTGYTVSTLDESAWSLIVANESVTYQIDCSPTNPKAIKVLFDGVSLNNHIYYQTTQGTFIMIVENALSINLISQSGDSAGVVASTQQFERSPEANIKLNNLIFTTQPLSNVIINGSFKAVQRVSDSRPSIEYYAIDGTGNNHLLVSAIYPKNETVSCFFNISIPIQSNKPLQIVALVKDYKVDSGLFDITFTFDATNIEIITQTKTQAQISYGLRAFDLMQGIVAKATSNKYTIRSNFFENQNTLDVCMSGDAIRQIPHAYIQSSFADWFKSFDAKYYLAMRIINGVLWVEPANVVYQQGSNIMDLGEISNLTLSPALEYAANEVKIGSAKQDYRHNNGRYEFNSTNSFSLPVKTVQKTLDLVSKYRFDSYGISFMILDYQGSSTKDNAGDTNVFVVRITDKQASATTSVETFIELTVDDAPLAPYIRYPSQNTWITNARPTVRGIAPIGSTVNVYVDHALNGTTTADSVGLWQYDIATDLSSYAYVINPDGTVTVTSSGQHTIDVTFTDDAGAINSVVVIVNTTTTTPDAITSLTDGQNIYDNQPLLKGVAQAGSVVTIKVDTITVGTATADGSCLWFFQLPILSNRNHKIEANTIVINVSVNSFVAYPLITSFLEGFIEINNLPLIKGVSLPNIPVTLYLNYITPTILGQVTSDANGNWAIQVRAQPFPTNPPIPYIPNGLNIISTLLNNQLVQIAVTGFELDRPSFTELDGVIDNTIFNTFYTPKRMLEARIGLWKSILKQIPNAQLHFEAADKNALLKTIIGGVVTQENAPLILSNYSEGELFLMIKAKFKTRVLDTFNQILYNFNQGGTIQGTYRGNVVYFMPIGSMTQASITDEAQEWELLLSPKNLLSNIAKLSKNSLTLNIMQNAIIISDYNTLHFIEYNFQKDPKYNTYQVYEQWFKDRNTQYVEQPDYYQPLQTTDAITVQIVNNGLSNIKLKVYNCITAVLLDTLLFYPVTIQPTVSPNITMEAYIDFTQYGEGEYFFVLETGGVARAISEKVWVQDVWENSILIEANDVINKVDTFFSTGFVSKLRIAGLVTNFIPDITTYQNKDEIGNNQLLHSVPSKKKRVFFGDATGVPDYIANKVSLMTQLSNCNIEGMQLVLSENSKFEPSEQIGYPMFFYKLDMELAQNTTSNTFLGSAGISGITIAVDASAFNGAVTGITNIDLQTN